MKSFFTKKNMIITGISLFVILAICIVVPPVYDAYFSDAVTSGVRLQGTAVGGKNEADISVMLDDFIAAPKATAIQVSDKTIALDMNSAGFSIDKEQTVADIMAQGKNDLFDSFAIRWGGKEAAISFHPDAEMFSAVTETLLAQEGLTEQRFDYTLDGDKVQVVIRPDIQTYAIRNRSKIYR